MTRDDFVTWLVSERGLATVRSAVAVGTRMPAYRPERYGMTADDVRQTVLGAAIEEADGCGADPVAFVRAVTRQVVNRFARKGVTCLDAPDLSWVAAPPPVAAEPETLEEAVAELCRRFSVAAVQAVLAKMTPLQRESLAAYHMQEAEEVPPGRLRNAVGKAAKRFKQLWQTALPAVA